jgi:hypothetical protein
MKIFGSGSVFPHDPADDLKFTIGSFNDLSDKPFGEEFVAVFNQTVTFGNGQYVQPDMLPFSVGDSVTVTFDGVKYELVVSSDPMGMGMGVLGNFAIMGDAVDTGEPFIMLNGTDPYQGSAFVIMAPGLETANVMIECTTVKTIDSKYIPANIGGGVVIVEDAAAASGVATVEQGALMATMNAFEIAQAVLSGKSVYFTNGYEDFVPFIYAFRLNDMMTGTMAVPALADPYVLFGAIREDGWYVQYKVYLDGSYEDTSYLLAMGK